MGLIAFVFKFILIYMLVSGLMAAWRFFRMFRQLKKSGHSAHFTNFSGNFQQTNSHREHQGSRQQNEPGTIEAEYRVVKEAEED